MDVLLFLLCLLMYISVMFVFTYTIHKLFTYVTVIDPWVIIIIARGKIKLHTDNYKIKY